MFKDLNVSIVKLKKLVKDICRRFADCRTKFQISIALVDNAGIRKINRKFLNQNYVTDCLSFDLSDDENQKSFELLVNAEKAEKLAALRGYSIEAELALYITHGLLHNLGFDDSTKTKAKKMHDMEDGILRQYGYGAVYNLPLNASVKKNKK
jgi:probable rRNA maturation factor